MPEPGTGWSSCVTHTRLRNFHICQPRVADEDVLILLQSMLDPRQKVRAQTWRPDRSCSTMYWKLSSWAKLMLASSQNQDGVAAHPRPMSSARMAPWYFGSRLPLTQSYRNCTPSVWCGRRTLSRKLSSTRSGTASGAAAGAGLALTGMAGRTGAAVLASGASDLKHSCTAYLCLNSACCREPVPEHESEST